MSGNYSTLLRGAYDCHVHCGPDVIVRAQDVTVLAESAAQAGLAGVVLKNHAGSTTGVAHVLNQQYSAGPQFYGSLVLNPPVGSLNPFAVEAALRLGTAVVFFPTYAAGHQIEVLGPNGFAPAFPRPGGQYTGIRILDEMRVICPEAVEIVRLIAKYDAVLATGHLSPKESLALLAVAQQQGVKRMLVTHASEPVPGMSTEYQKRAVALGALVEHSVMAMTDCCARKLTLREFAQQIREVGVEHVVISSDLGQVGNGPPVATLGYYLEQLQASGFSADELRTMILRNPVQLLGGAGGTLPT